jgi:hypothetical protein
MGIFACETHGLQGFFQACKHVSEALSAGLIIPRITRLGMEVCHACEVDFGLARFADVNWSNWTDAAQAQYDRLHPTSECHCTECVAAVELAYARAQGATDPFPAFEHTLTFLQRDLVARLETELLEAFEFQPSIADPPGPAVSVRHGALTYPLEITIYYVCERSAQEAILAWLDSFFARVSRPERRVRFYRAENWHEYPVSPPAISGWRRGPEELLLQHDVGAP